MPHMHVYDAFHAETALIPVTRINGITNAIVAPASTDTLPGQDSFIQLDGNSADEMFLVRDIALPLNFTGEQRRKESVGRSGSIRRRAWAWQRNCGRRSSMHSDYERRWRTTKEESRRRARTSKPEPLLRNAT